jgi:hypothetical protein
MKLKRCGPECIHCACGRERIKCLWSVEKKWPDMTVKKNIDKKQLKKDKKANRKKGRK